MKANRPNTSRPSDASIVAAMIEYFSRGGEIEDPSCNCDICAIVRRARTLDAEREQTPPQSVGDKSATAQPVDLVRELKRYALLYKSHLSHLALTDNVDSAIARATAYLKEHGHE